MFKPALLRYSRIQPQLLIYWGQYISQGYSGICENWRYARFEQRDFITERQLAMDICHRVESAEEKVALSRRVLSKLNFESREFSRVVRALHRASVCIVPYHLRIARVRLRMPRYIVRVQGVHDRKKHRALTGSDYDRSERRARSLNTEPKVSILEKIS
ncbi:hypothetical protein EVAR_27210_1 [Eumeta japonica]|uniref:Uncharacterized protein n=1 Tax=Eumeta variegata TaxID=151549 RepID=A0A4C1VYE6_EUMVA|nr:hypothetical protein EVAR_27210_1 [Eumeta japonica]